VLLTAHARMIQSREQMARMVQCVQLGQESEGLDRPPFKGPLGERVYERVSKQAWRSWLEHSKMLINEYRLDLTSPDGQRVWMKECEKYFFGEGYEAPPEFVPKA
jgi:Fe-S cluster biosynthesis and repair protein YggX